MQQLKKSWIYIVSGVLLFLVILLEAQVKGDFDIFMYASADLLKGKNIYAETYHEWYHYYYSVFFALVLSPLTFLPLYFVKVLWLSANVFFVYRIWKVISSLLPLDFLSKKIQMIFTVLAFLFVLKFLRDNFHVAQVTILILYLTLEGLRLIWNDKPLMGAFLLALGIDIKLLPLVFLPYLIYRGEWKALFFCLLFLFVFALIPGIFIGFEFNSFLLAERWNLLNPSNQEHVLDTAERSFHSLTTFLATLLVEDSGDKFALPLKRNVADLTIDQLNLVINIARLLLIGFTLYFLRSKPFKSSVQPLQRLYEISYICLVIPLIFPHQQHYAFFFIFPASTYLLFYLFRKYYSDSNSLLKVSHSSRNVLSGLLILIFFLVNSHFILGTFNEYYDHFKTLTWGVLLLLIVLACCPPEKDSAIS